ncbi:unnamed protein product [Lymnaea stagnalis]|uniref:Uncharacterized protein n=1 Tax=Lymnaea stagnalis TaxID=6523 RepID=A0AAV2HXS7_LYMST
MKRMSCTENVISSTDNRGGGAGGGAMRAAIAAAESATAAEANRSLVVDKAYFEEQFLRCQVCHERFNQSEQAPKSLPCNHTFCLTCLTQIYDHAQPQAQPRRAALLWGDDNIGGALKCPTCRVEIFLIRSKIKDLPNDHRVVQMIDFLSQAMSKPQNDCAKHERQPLNFFCKKCLIPVCRDCTVLDHKETEGHVITDVSDAMRENAAQFTHVENQSKQTLEKMKKRSDSLANASKRLDILERHLKSEIKEQFIEYRLLLEKRQEALTGMVTQIIKDQKCKINTKYAVVCQHGEQLQKLFDSLKSCRASNDIRQLFNINQEIKEHENVFTEVANQDDTELYQACEFEAQNEGHFLSHMSGLGEVRTRPDLSLRTPVSMEELRLLSNEEERENQRREESENQSEMFFQEFMARDVERATDNILGHYESGEDEDYPQMQWPSHSVINQLISQRHWDESISRSEPQEEMDEGDSAPLGNLRASQRRGRRPRDTNSSQVTSSIINDPSYLAATAARPTTRTTQRSGSRSRNTAPQLPQYQVLRHLPSAGRQFNLSHVFYDDTTN